MFSVVRVAIDEDLFWAGALKSVHHRGHGEHGEGRQREVGYALNAGVAEVRRVTHIRNSLCVQKLIVSSVLPL